ncbi:MAG: hypothetical protein QOC63_2298, partial [Mycobacterium sp.]|nr:hypothetical protein [Mycobacterium sp.]
ESTEPLHAADGMRGDPECEEIHLTRLSTSYAEVADYKRQTNPGTRMGHEDRPDETVRDNDV